MIKPLELVSNCQKGRLRGWVAKGSLSFCFLSPILEVHAGGVFAWVWLDGDYLSCPETFGACKLIKCVNKSKGIEFTSPLSSTTHLGDGQDGVDFGSRHWLALIFFLARPIKAIPLIGCWKVLGVGFPSLFRETHANFPF